MKSVFDKCNQARSQDLEKGGAILKEWEVCKRPWLEFSLTLNQFQTVCQNLRRNVSKRSKLQPFFPPKIKWSPKKKKKKKKKKGLRQNSRRFFFQNFASSNVSGGALFAWGGLFSIFHRKSASKAQKTCDFAYFTRQWGGLEPPPPPPLATLLSVIKIQILLNSLKCAKSYDK